VAVTATSGAEFGLIVTERQALVAATGLAQGFHANIFPKVLLCCLVALPKANLPHLVRFRAHHMRLMDGSRVPLFTFAKIFHTHLAPYFTRLPGSLKGRKTEP